MLQAPVSSMLTWRGFDASREQPRRTSSVFSFRFSATLSNYFSSAVLSTEKAFDLFLATYGTKYPKATGRLAKDRTELLAFYDFPAEHWVHIRTTNPIEATFATVKLRTAKTRNCLSRTSMVTMGFTEISHLAFSRYCQLKQKSGSNGHPAVPRSQVDRLELAGT